MNKFSFILVLIALIIGGLAGLIWSANQGNTTASFVLGILLAVTLVTVGFVLYGVSSHIQYRREQKQFSTNIKENLGVMAAMQSVQNKQNALLLKQTRALPAPPDEAAILDFDDAIFSELDEAEND